MAISRRLGGGALWVQGKRKGELARIEIHTVGGMLKSGKVGKGRGDEFSSLGVPRYEGEGVDEGDDFLEKGSLWRVGISLLPGRI